MDDKPDFSEFKDWLVKGGPGGDWPVLFTPTAGVKLNQKQREIVARNARLLLDKEKWTEKVSRFENELAKIVDENKRQAQCKDFHIRFDGFCFESSNGIFDFSRLHFPCSVNFTGATFGDGAVQFNEATFGDGIVSFDGAKFGKGDVSLDLVIFGEGNVRFNQAIFGDGMVTFSGVNFGKGGVRFTGVKFGDGDVLFNSTIFGDGSVSFNDATFGERNVTFAGAAFGTGDATFIGTNFCNGNVGFGGANFGKGVVLFQKAEFGDGDVIFDPNKLTDTSVFFLGAEVAGNLVIKVLFPKTADFQRLNVEGTTQFSGCEFKEIPDFRDAKFDRPPEVARMVVPAPELVGTWRNFGNCKDEDAVSKYRKLKAMALAAHDHEMDGKFFAYEMMAKRGTETKGFFPLLFNSLYGILSNYGQSFGRPIGLLFFSWFGFAATYLQMLGKILTSNDRGEFAMEYSLHHTIPVLSSLYRFAVKPTDTYESEFRLRFGAVQSELGNIDSFTNLAIIQQFIGLVLLFLLLLALRNTFRLK